MEGVCFVIQGFGIKTDFETGRKLNLDASYEVIKEAVEATGLTCIRADEVQHAGVIDKPMYESILESDLVIADLSTSNVNAFYELGVRHALRPHVTIIVAEQNFTKAFDINRNLIRTYKHLGEDVGRAESIRFSKELQSAIEQIMSKPDTDSPLYTYLPDMQRPQLKPEQADKTGISTLTAGASLDDVDHEGTAPLLRQFRKAKAASDWNRVIIYLQDLRKLKPDDDYLTQQLALATYKQKPDDDEALNKARSILLELDPVSSHDAETLGLWGAVHKRLWEKLPVRADYQNQAILAYKRGFYFGNDYYNGINYAFLLNTRAVSAEPALAIADWVEAERIRQEVIRICEDRLAMLETDDALQNERYWILATLWEAALGVGDTEMARRWEQQARASASESWMLSESTEPQIAALQALLVHSPLRYLKTSESGDQHVI